MNRYIAYGIEYIPNMSWMKHMTYHVTYMYMSHHPCISNWGTKLQRPATGGALLVLWLWAAWLKSHDLWMWILIEKKPQFATFFCGRISAVFFFKVKCGRWRWWLKVFVFIGSNMRGFKGSLKICSCLYLTPAGHKEPIQSTTSGRRTHCHLVLSRLRAIHWKTQDLLVRPAVFLYICIWYTRSIIYLYIHMHNNIYIYIYT